MEMADEFLRMSADLRNAMNGSEDNASKTVEKACNRLFEIQNDAEKTGLAMANNVGETMLELIAKYSSNAVILRNCISSITALTDSNERNRN